MPISFGFHPYLRLPGERRESWEIELPVAARLVLDEHMIPTGRTEAVEFPRERLGERGFDDGFADLAPRPFVVAGGGRELALSFDEGYPYAQVYSPPGAAFICFEPMTAPTNALCSGDALPPAGARPELRGRIHDLGLGAVIGRPFRACFPACRVESMEVMAWRRR